MAMGGTYINLSGGLVSSGGTTWNVVNTSDFSQYNTAPHIAFSEWLKEFIKDKPVLFVEHVKEISQKLEALKQEPVEQLASSPITAYPGTTITPGSAVTAWGGSGAPAAGPTTPGAAPTYSVTTGYAYGTTDWNGASTLGSAEHLTKAALDQAFMEVAQAELQAKLNSKLENMQQVAVDNSIELHNKKKFGIAW